MSCHYLQHSDSDTGHPLLLQPVLVFSAHGTPVLPDTQTQMFGIHFSLLTMVLSHTFKWLPTTNYHYFFLEKILGVIHIWTLIAMCQDLSRSTSISSWVSHTYLPYICICTSMTIFYTIIRPPISITSSRPISSNIYWKFLPRYLSGISNSLSLPQRPTSPSVLHVWITAVTTHFVSQAITLDMTFIPLLIPSALPWNGSQTFSSSLRLASSDCHS